MEETVSPAGIFQSALRAEIYVSVSVALPVTVTSTWQKPLKGRDLLWFMVSVSSVLDGRKGMAERLHVCGSGQARK